MDETSHLRVSWSVVQIFLPIGGWTNQALHKWLGKKISYLRMDGHTNPLTSTLVKDPNLPTYKAMNDLGDERSK